MIGPWLSRMLPVMLIKTCENTANWALDLSALHKPRVASISAKHGTSSCCEFRPAFGKVAPRLPLAMTSVFTVFLVESCISSHVPRSSLLRSETHEEGKIQCRSADTNKAFFLALLKQPNKATRKPPFKDTSSISINRSTRERLTSKVSPHRIYPDKLGLGHFKDDTICRERLKSLIKQPCIRFLSVFCLFHQLCKLHHLLEQGQRHRRRTTLLKTIRISRVSNLDLSLFLLAQSQTWGGILRYVL